MATSLASVGVNPSYMYSSHGAATTAAVSNGSGQGYNERPANVSITIAAVASDLGWILQGNSLG